MLFVFYPILIEDERIASHWQTYICGRQPLLHARLNLSSTNCSNALRKGNLRVIDYWYRTYYITYKLQVVVLDPNRAIKGCKSTIHRYVAAKEPTNLIPKADCAT